MNSKVCFSFGVALVAGACGDDVAATVDAPKPVIDAPLPMVDAPDPINFMSDEGGEVRFEYVRFGVGTGAREGTASARVISFFEGNDDVDFHPYPTIPGCTLMVDDTKWPVAQPTNRQYVDIGQQLTLTNGSQILNVPKASIAADPVGRVHGVGNHYFYAPFPATGGGDAAQFITEKTAYDVILSGSATWPAQVFPDAIQMPAAFDLISPSVTTPVVLKSDGTNTDLTITWQAVPSGQPAGVPDAWFAVGFVIPTTSFVVLCIEPMNDGSLTVPAAMVNMIATAAPSGGTMVRQSFIHQVRELTNGTTVKRRRIDMIGTWCHATGFSVQ